MIEEQSNYYFRVPEEMGERIDFVYNHLYFDYLKSVKTNFNCRDICKKTDKGPDFSEMFECFDSGIDFKGAKYVDEGIFYYRAGDISDENFLEVNEETKKVPEDFITEESIFLEENDVLVVKDGATTGKVGYVRDNAPKGIFNTHLFKMKCKEKKIKAKYLFHFLKSKIGQDQIRKNISGSAQGGITLNDIASLFLIMPNSQKDIIKKIDPLEKEALNLKARSRDSLTKANKILLDELGIDLGEKEISYFFKKGKHDSSDYYFNFSEGIGGRFHYLFNHPKLEMLDKFKNKYQTVLLGDICREPIKTGEQPRYSDFGVMVIKTVDLKNRFIDYENTLRVSEEFYESKPEAHIQKNDILVTSTGYVSAGKTDIFDIGEPALADPQLLILRLNEEYDINFITYYLRSCFGQVQFDRWFSGSSGQIHLYPEDIAKFIIPSKESIRLDKQKEIANKITEEYKKALGYERQAKCKRQEAKELFEKLILQG